MEQAYVELVIEGPAAYVRGFVHGYAIGRDRHEEIIFDHEAGFADDNVIQRLKEKLHLSREITHCIASEETAALVREGLNKSGEAKLTVRSERKIAKAGFAFAFEIFNQERGEDLAAMLRDLPENTLLLEHEAKITTDPSAKGTELYSPVHDYEYVGKGRIEGPVDKIVWLYKELSSFDQVEVEPIETAYRS